MDSQLHTFIKGLNKDLDYRMTPESVYIDAHNIRIINDTGGSSMSLNNIRGNSYNISIPTTEKVQKITITNESLPSSLTINTITGDTYTLSGLSYKGLYDLILSDAAFTGEIGVLYNIYYGDSYLYFIPIDNNIIPNITTVGGGLTINTNYIEASSNPEIIGSANIRGDIYLFVAANGGTDNKDSQAPTNSIGQIWKYTYNKITNVGNLILIYNNYINFSTYWCIAPTAALGRYENSQIQRIYWTDNYNKLRELNVSNSQSLALDPTILDITPAVDFDIPILTNILNVTGPTIKVGCYQMAYRLLNTYGAVTCFSELSNQVFVCDGDPVGVTQVNFKDYIGAGQGTLEGNHITWIINNIDRDFDRIEFAIVQKENLTSTPNVFTVGEQPITGDSMSFTFDGSLETTPITINEFLALSGIFTHCKTIATKDNRLFVANVRNQQSELDFDARAFRAKNINQEDIYLTNNGTESIFTLADATDPILNPETNDDINDYRTIPQGGTGNTGYYKPNTTILGGSGLNISYEFVTIASRCDQTSDAIYPFSPPTAAAPWRCPNRNYSEDFIDLGVNSNGIEQEYTNVFSTGKTFGGLKYSNVSGVLKGYQRNEIYRLGIQFFDKSKNPYFVKWIGDIKMPDFSHSNINSFYEDGITPTGIIDFRLSFTDTIDGQLQAFVQSLGIKFTVNNLSSISDQISGYSIVRVKREEKDKSIISGGYISAVVNDGFGGGFYTSGVAVNASGNPVTWTAFPPVYNKVCFSTPNLCNPYLTNPSTGNTFKIKFILQHSNTANNAINVGAMTGANYYYKMYDNDVILPTGEQETTLAYASYIAFANTIPTSGGSGNIFRNYDADDPNSNASRSYSMGNETYLLELNSNNANLYSDLYASDPFGKYYVNIERILTNQYGGNTYTARANNEYISCCHFKPIDTTTIPFTDDFFVFGSDIFVDLYDDARWTKNLNVTGRPQVPGPITYSGTMFFPVESTVNSELRNGRYINRSFDSVAEQEFIQDSTYNGVYSSENDIKTFFPKPDPFINNDEFDNRFYASDIKINGELIDSWGLFRETNYWDVEGIYGPINAAIILQDKLYFYQNRAFGIMEVNPRAVVTDVNNTSNPDLQLGTGLPLQRHDYISTEVGLQHQWGVTKSSYKLFWADVANKKFFSYGAGQAITPESDVKGLFSYFTENLKNNILNYDKPVYEGNSTGLNGVRSVYDFKYNQAIFTFTDGVNREEIQNDFTLVFDEAINAFTTFTDYKPKVYFGDGYKILSTDRESLEDIYMHDIGNYGEFYDVKYPSTIKFAFNKNPASTKVFDNLKLDVQSLNNDVNQYSDFWNIIRIYDDYQNTDFITLTPTINVKRKERTWQLPIFRNRVINTGNQSPDIFDNANLSPVAKPFGDRIRDKYCVVDLIYNNNDNNLLITNNVIMDYRQSDR